MVLDPSPPPLDESHSHELHVNDTFTSHSHTLWMNQMIAVTACPRHPLFSCMSVSLTRSRGNHRTHSLNQKFCITLWMTACPRHPLFACRSVSLTRSHTNHLTHSLYTWLWHTIWMTVTYSRVWVCRWHAVVAIPGLIHCINNYALHYEWLRVRDTLVHVNKSQPFIMWVTIIYILNKSDDCHDCVWTTHSYTWISHSHS